MLEHTLNKGNKLLTTADWIRRTENGSRQAVTWAERLRRRRCCDSATLATLFKTSLGGYSRSTILSYSGQSTKVQVGSSFFSVIHSITLGLLRIARLQEAIMCHIS